MKIFNTLLFSAALTLFFISGSFADQAPQGKFEDLLTELERNPQIQNEIDRLAISNNLPVEIYLEEGIYITALGVENGKIVYGIMNNMADIYNGAETSFIEGITARYNLSNARVHYADGRVNNPSIGMPVPSHSEGLGTKWIIMPESTNDKVWAFDPETGDVIDPDFIPTDLTHLNIPQHAVQTPRGTITISDQNADGVFEYDTSGTFIRLFAPAGGINTSILDNVRGHYYRPNGNLLVAVGGSTMLTVVPQFDTGGVHLGPFISGNVNSTWFLLPRDNTDILVTSINSPQGLGRFSPTGTFLGSFASVTSFPQQSFLQNNGDVAVANFTSGPQEGVLIFPAAGGSFIRQLTGVSGNRGVWVLGNGNYLTSNAAGVHELDSATGNLVRTIAPGIQGRMFSLYDTDLLVGLNNPTGSVPDNYSLSQNYPNPFNPSTKISFSIPDNQFVTLKIYNALGKEVKTLVSSKLNAGTYDYSFEAGELSSGMYFYTLEAGYFMETKKMVLIK